MDSDRKSEVTFRDSGVPSFHLSEDEDDDGIDVGILEESTRAILEKLSTARRQAEETDGYELVRDAAAKGTSRASRVPRDAVASRPELSDSRLLSTSGSRTVAPMEAAAEQPDERHRVAADQQRTVQTTKRQTAAEANVDTIAQLVRKRLKLPRRPTSPPRRQREVQDDFGEVGKNRIATNGLRDQPTSTYTLGARSASDAESKSESRQPSVVQKRTPTIRLSTYDGSSMPLETFLSKFENCSQYCEWTERDRLYHLKASLDGNAAQVLWQLSDQSTEKEIITLLRNRFGNIDQHERFRAELRARRRLPGESVQSVYQDIRRLLALGYPGEFGTVIEILGRDCLLDALDDPALRQRVLDSRPSSLDDCLATICRMEAYSAPKTSRHEDEEVRRRGRVAAVAAENVTTSVVNESHQAIGDRRLKHLETMIAEQSRRIKQLESETTKQQQTAVVTTPPPSIPYWTQPPTPVWNGSPYWTTPAPTYGPMYGTSYDGCQLPVQSPPSAPNDLVSIPPPTVQTVTSPPTSMSPTPRQQPNKRRGACHYCGSFAHWKAACPDAPQKKMESPTTRSTAHVQIVQDKCPKSETYLEIVIGSRHRVLANIDSGCDQSVIGARLVTQATLVPTDTRLFVADEREIEVIGKTRIFFTVNGIELHADVLVSPDLNILLLGFNWLHDNNASWDFRTSVLTIGGLRAKLQSRQSRALVRRVYARENVRIPANSIAHVSVKLPRFSLHTPISDWLIESKEVTPGVFAARTLVTDDDKHALVRIINATGISAEIKEGYCFGNATPGLVCGEKTIQHQGLEVSGCIAGQTAECGAQPDRRDEVSSAPPVTERPACDDDRDISGLTVKGHPNDRDYAVKNSERYHYPAQTHSAEFGHQNNHATTTVKRGSASTATIAGRVNDEQCVTRGEHVIIQVEPDDDWRPVCSLPENWSTDADRRRPTPDSTFEFNMTAYNDSDPYATDPTIGCTGMHDPVNWRRVTWYDLLGEGSSRERAPPAQWEDVHVWRPAPRRDLTAPTGALTQRAIAASGETPTEPRKTGATPTAHETPTSEIYCKAEDNAARVSIRTVKPLINSSDNTEDNSAIALDFRTLPIAATLDTADYLAKCELDDAADPDSDIIGGIDCEPPIDQGKFDHIQEVINNLTDDLTVDQRRRAIDLVKRNADLFARHDLDVGKSPLMQHKIDTGDAKPICEPLRRHNRAHLDQIDRAVDNLLAAGLIEESDSEWASNIVVVTRPGSPKLRITLDMRAVNSVTLKQTSWPMPTIRDCLDSLSGSVMFSQMDLSSAFHSIALADLESKNRTSFITRKGLFRWTRMPMGGVNSPSAFCRLMHLALNGLNFVTCLVYVDDVIVMARNFEEAVHNLQEVWDRLRAAGVRLKASKTFLFRKETKFLGRIVREGQIFCDPARTATIQSIMFPKNITELRRIIGMANFHRCFLKNHSDKMEPLTEMLRASSGGITWTPRRQKALDDLKLALSNPPALHMPVEHCDNVNCVEHCSFCIDTDASDSSAGAVLYQYINGRLCTIQYASRNFNQSERRYCVTKKEMAALVFALKEFRHYILGSGRKTTVLTDHGAITYFLKKRDVVGQMARYIEFVSQFNIEIKYKSGSSNVLADQASRVRPCEAGPNAEPCRQCNRRITGEHSVNQVRAQARTRQGLNRAKVHAKSANPPPDHVSTDNTRDEPRRSLRQRRQNSRLQTSDWILGTRPSRRVDQTDQQTNGSPSAVGTCTLLNDDQTIRTLADDTAIDGSRQNSPSSCPSNHSNSPTINLGNRRRGRSKRDNKQAKYMEQNQYCRDEDVDARGKPLFSIGEEENRNENVTDEVADETNEHHYDTRQQAKLTSKPRRQFKQSHLSRTAPTAIAAGIEHWSPAYLSAEQEKDEDLRQVRDWIIHGQGRPDWDDVRSGSPALRALYLQYESIVVREGVLYRVFHSTDCSIKHLQFIAPAQMRAPILDLVHSDLAGHFRYKKCLELVQRYAWWLTFRRDLKLFIQCCAKCNEFHRGPAPHQGRLKPVLVGSFGEKWCIDLVGPLPTSQGYRFILTCTDVFTRYLVCVPLKTKEAHVVTEAVNQHVFSVFGLPSEVQSDCGNEVDSQLPRELYRLLGIHKVRTSVYHPACNGVAEITHRSLHKLFSAVVSTHQRDWVSYLSYVVFVYNATKHSATDYAPYFLVFGKLPTWNVDLLLSNNEHRDTSVPQFVAERLERMRQAELLVRENLQRAADKASEWYNKRVKPQIFLPGEEVRVYSPRGHQGRTPKWTGLYAETGHVKKRLNDVTYVVEHPQWRGPRILHVDKLKRVIKFSEALKAIEN